ncbi:MAG: hypothetical protein WBF93_14885 [Pirellulales bacterium]|nr:hypothetical protein [Pirellulales bacterium]
MISLKNNTQYKFSEDARRAIADGVQQDDPVANLEYLGMTLRTLNILENSEQRITKLIQLVSLDRDQLMAMPNVTSSVLAEILDTLSRYHQLEEARLKIPPLTPRGSKR